LEKYVAWLEGEVEFLREENATKNAQIRLAIIGRLVFGLGALQVFGSAAALAALALILGSLQTSAAVAERSCLANKHEMDDAIPVAKWLICVFENRPGNDGEPIAVRSIRPNDAQQDTRNTRTHRVFSNCVAVS
jgi:hypothetical protein